MPAGLLTLLQPIFVLLCDFGALDPNEHIKIPKSYSGKPADQTLTLINLISHYDNA